MSSLLLWCDLLLDHEWDNDLKQCYVFTTTMMCPIIGPRVGLWYKQCYVFTTSMMCPIIGHRVRLGYKQCYVFTTTMMWPIIGPRVG